MSISLLNVPLQAPVLQHSGALSFSSLYLCPSQTQSQSISISFIAPHSVWLSLQLPDLMTDFTR